jgi:hypothetical protein
LRDEQETTGANSMFLQWCRDELVESYIFVQRLVSWDRTRLRKGTTAETQTLAASPDKRANRNDLITTNANDVDEE